ncbi:glucose-dependent insulinotropic receptor-like [Episyrphus balteatus]|uniref:glucose-dependent insulinotropic receptor-like n=1 Tax=Episyrphus balteatus TaxID=286459 RepID=UPI00248632B9|nr:glucose-dependent insulinotropic receptor-like [Episyrphus balteatus]
MGEKTIGEILTNEFVSKHESRLFSISGTFICITIICVNFSVVFSSFCLLKRGQEPRATYIFLGSICLADMISGIVTLFMVNYFHQLNNAFLCGISVGLAGTTGLASSFFIGLIAIDRYLYIMNGLHYHRYFTTRHPYLMVLLVWLISAVPGCGPSFTFSDYYSMDEFICFFLVLIPPKISLIPMVIAIVPMILIMILYSIILKSALNSRSRLNRSTQSSFQNHEGNLRVFRGREQKIITLNSADEDLPSRVRKFGLPCCRWSKLEITPNLCDESKWKAVKIVAYTTGAYFITCFPYFVTSICYAFCDFKLNFEYCHNLFVLMRKPLFILYIANNLFNPLIYAWWHPGFRISVKKMYSRLFVKIHPKPSIPASKIHKTNFFRENGHENFDSQI